MEGRLFQRHPVGIRRKGALDLRYRLPFEVDGYVAVEDVRVLVRAHQLLLRLAGVFQREVPVLEVVGELDGYALQLEIRRLPVVDIEEVERLEEVVQGVGPPDAFQEI